MTRRCVQVRLQHSMSIKRLPRRPLHLTAAPPAPAPTLLPACNTSQRRTRKRGATAPLPIPYSSRRCPRMQTALGILQAPPLHCRHVLRAPARLELPLAMAAAAAALAQAVPSMQQGCQMQRQARLVTRRRGGTYGGGVTVQAVCRCCVRACLARCLSQAAAVRRSVRLRQG